MVKGNGEGIYCSKRTGPIFVSYAFTLIELLVVITIISILAALLLPSLSSARGKAKYARWLQYKNNLRTDPNLVAYYDFEEKGGTLLENKALCAADPDAVPANLNGTIVSGTWTKTEGRWIGKGAMEFNGISDYINIGTDASLNFKDSSLTVEAWVYYTYTTAGVDYAIFGSTDSAPRRRISLRSNAFSREGVPGMNEVYPIGGGTGVTAGQWNHLVGVYDADNSKLYVYWNGEVKNETAHSGTLGAPTRNLIGANPSDNGTGVGWYMEGRIDEVAIYNRALTATEVRDHYKMGKP